MGVSEILATIDHEIAQLQQARALLSGGAAPVVAKKKAGRPKKVVAVAVVAAKPAKKAKKKKRNLSPEGRKRIAEAVKKRWAAQKAAAAK
jgi:nitrogen fixation protein FixH